MRRFIHLFKKITEYTLVIGFVIAIFLYFRMGFLTENFLYPKLMQKRYISEHYQLPLLQSADQHRYLLVHIGGHGPYKLVVDTHSPFLVLKESVAHDLKLNQLWERIAFHDLNQNQVPDEGYYTLHNLEVGPITFRKVNIISEKGFEDTDIDGVIPLSFFSDFLTTLQLSANQLELEYNQQMNNQHAFNYSRNEIWMKPLFRNIYSHMLLDLHYVENQKEISLPSLYLDLSAHDSELIFNRGVTGMTTQSSLGSRSMRFPFWNGQVIEYERLKPKGYFMLEETKQKFRAMVEVPSSQNDSSNVLLPNRIGAKLLQDYTVVIDQKLQQMAFVKNKANN